MKTQADLEKLTVAELISLHNENVPAEKAVKKFADKKTAVRRTLQALAKKNVEKAEKKRAEPKAASRSEAIQRSWADPKTRAARAARYAVRASGQNFPSVPAAFRALGLPMSVHIPFRGKLRDAGTLDFVYQDSDGAQRKVKFTIVEAGAK